MIPLTDKEKKEYEEAEICFICKKEFGSKYDFESDEENESDEEDVSDDEEEEKKEEKNGLEKVRDHCHFTGKYRGAAHSKCNLKFRKPNFIPIFAHNSSNYDLHLFIKNSSESDGVISIIPTNEEKYISLSKKVKVKSYYDKKKKKTVDVFKEARFLDSYKFIDASLSNLVDDLGKLENFKILTKEFKDEEKLKLLLRKGVFPYEWLDCFEKLEETQLPPIEKFYSSLNDEHIKPEDYKHALKVFDVFECKTIKDYLHLYNKSDVLQLADVFQAFRTLCLETHGLDPAHCFTSPGFTWEAALKYTNETLHVIRDIKKFLDVERGIKGGTSMIAKRHLKANDKYLSNFNQEEESKYIIYLDCNNLYGGAMCDDLPTGGFRWMTQSELKNWRNYSCILVVDLIIPEKYHDKFKDYPPAPERKKVDGVEKLICDYYPKNFYTIHYKNLKQYIDLGCKLSKIHRGFKFKESKWLKPYIDLNTRLRSEPGISEFKKRLYKLFNNAFFGKSMENLRNRENVTIVRSKKQAQKFINKPNFKHFTIFNENLISIHMGKTKVKLNKPIYLGFSILELSKTTMYKFHYNYIKPKYGDRAELGPTDTDSLIYEIKTEDFYKDISDDVDEWFDTSDYPKNGHPSGIPVGKNKKVVGMFKNETNGNEILECIGLKPKMYSYEMDDKNCCASCGVITETNDDGTCKVKTCGKPKKYVNKKCKGIKKNVINNGITMDHYRECLKTREKQYCYMKNLRSYDHQIYTETINKISLSANDDKRYILPDGINTLPWGHRDIEKIEKNIKN